MNINITEKAEKVLLEKNVGADNFLRIHLTEGGCAGMTFEAEVDNSLQGDESIIFEKPWRQMEEFCRGPTLERQEKS